MRKSGRFSQSMVFPSGSPGGRGAKRYSPSNKEDHINMSEMEDIDDAAITRQSA